MPYISIVVPTMRVGGVDILLESLAKQTFTDFELVLVDGLYRHRARQVAELAKDLFLRVVHVEPRPNPFPVAAFCKYANTGLVHASGEVVLFCVDFTSLPSDLVQAHAEFHKRSGPADGLMCPHRYVALDASGFPPYASGEALRYEEDLRRGVLDQFMLSIGKPTDQDAQPWVVDGGHAKSDADPKLRMPPGPIAPVFFHGKNESIKLERALDINGWDEDLDGTHCWQDSDFADRLSVKAGVKWVLDPSHVALIANPRNVFPMAKRLRDFRTNEGIWYDKRSRGYPTPNNYNLREQRARGSAPVIAQVTSASIELSVILPGKVEEIRNTVSLVPSPLKIAMIYGEFSSAIHGPFDLEGLYTRQGLTGSESSFFNLARTLSERGHEVAVFCKCVAPAILESGVNVVPIQSLPSLRSMPVDAVIAWNEPDYLQFAPPGVPRICDQQLNDFGYCRMPNWKQLVDRWVSPSAHHAKNVMEPDGLVAEVIPNSVDLDLFAGPAHERDPKRVVYCSSPDRGLHHLLGWWPEIRRRVPGANLRIFYRLAPWLERARNNDDEVGRRARYIEEAVSRLCGNYDYGVTITGLVPNSQMASELRRAAVLAYPCDPVRYTEGFGCSVLDAAAADCLPIISDADALPSVHGKAAIVSAGRPDGNREQWIQGISLILLNGWKDRAGMAAHARAHSREAVTDQWENLLGRLCASRAVAA